MNELETFSDQLAALVAGAASSVVQVQRASGVVYADDVVLANARALGREDGLRVRTHDGRALDAELHGWDPSTGLALLRSPGLGIAPAKPAVQPARVGNLAVAIGRSWSNALTASIGIVSVIGGPLRTGRGRSIDEVIRTTAPMHEGFAGGAFIDMTGNVAGVATAAAIRGLGVIIPSSIAWKTAASLLEHGRIRRGYLGIASQPVRLAERQRDDDREHALLVVDVRPGSPAEEAGLLVGDVITQFDGQPVEEPEDLLDLLGGDRIGKSVVIRIVRGENSKDVAVTIGERTT
ncbi:MAG TPA: trypsin-like peptidase domain-containing protein [Thermoanaerobaculia bacterium]|nr:trypsin-like peptidase domain-containing protein [Thermoanaerobaculia bacterium]